MTSIMTCSSLPIPAGKPTNCANACTRERLHTRTPAHANACTHCRRSSRSVAPAVNPMADGEAERLTFQLNGAVRMEAGRAGVATGWLYSLAVANDLCVPEFARGCQWWGRTSSRPTAMQGCSDQLGSERMREWLSRYRHS
jgi:hypothetical protein